MSNLTDTSSFDDVYQIETTDDVIGGPGGTANKQAQELANRTRWLKDRIGSSSTIDVARDTDLALSAAQYSKAILKLTGTPTAAFNMIFPTETGMWIVENGQGGSFNITAKTAAGTGVVVPAGQSVIIFCDGTNIVFASSAGAAAFLTPVSITGATGSTLTVTGGYTAGNIFVEKNGGVLHQSDFTATNGSTIALVTAAVSTDKFTVYRFNSFNVANAVQKSGDVMGGPLTLAGNAANPLEAVPKQQMDAAIAFSPSAVGARSNLRASATGGNANVSITADEIVLKSAANSYMTARGISVTINTAASGANGLDTGTVAASTWYNLFVISKADGTIAGLASLSATAPTLPSGYVNFARVGAIRTDGTANKFPLGFSQRDRYTTLLIGSANVSTPPVMASGASGAYSTSTFTGVAVAWANYAPPTAAKIRVGMSGNNTGILIGVASNANRTGFATANPPELGFDSSAYPLITFGDLQMETSNIYWACSGGTGYLLSGGWEDNL